MVSYIDFTIEEESLKYVKQQDLFFETRTGG